MVFINHYCSTVRVTVLCMWTNFFVIAHVTVLPSIGPVICVKRTAIYTQDFVYRAALILPYSQQGRLLRSIPGICYNELILRLITLQALGMASEDTPLESVHAFIDTVHSYKEASYFYLRLIVTYLMVVVSAVVMSKCSHNSKTVVHPILNHDCPHSDPDMALFASGPASTLVMG